MAGIAIILHDPPRRRRARPVHHERSPSLLGRLRAALAAITRTAPAVPFLAAERRHARHDIGEWSYGDLEVVYWDAGASLRIGRFCSIAPGVVVLLGGEHHSDWVTTYPFSLNFQEAAALPGYPHTKGDVRIGNDVWIGRDALVLSGVTVHDGAVIGARSVVTRDVEPYSIVAGNPARRLRYRFSPERIEALRRIAWWDWPLDEIKKALPVLQSGDVDGFIARYGRTAASN